MAGAGADLAADQDVPLQEDLRHPDPRPREPPQARRGRHRVDEALARAAAPQMGQLPIREGRWTFC